MSSNLPTVRRVAYSNAQNAMPEEQSRSTGSMHRDTFVSPATPISRPGA